MASERQLALTAAYWKLREHASALRSTFVYTRAQERFEEAREAEREGLAMASDRRWRETYARLRGHAAGIESAARDIADMLGIEENEVDPLADAERQERTE